MSTVELQTLKTSDVLAMAAPYNPRRIEESEFEALRRSLREFGIVEPVIVNRATERVVGGHQRAKAAEAESIEDLPVIFVELDERREKALNLALNKISGEWDEPLLRTILSELAGADEIDLTGFGQEEVERLLGEFDADLAELPDLRTGDVQDFRTMTFVFTGEQYAAVEAAIERCDTEPKNAALPPRVENYLSRLSDGEAKVKALIREAKVELGGDDDEARTASTEKKAKSS